MAGELYASGNWHVRQGSADAFLEAWREFLGWTRGSQPGLKLATLIRAEGNDHHFISFAVWESEDARTAWRETDGFMKRFSACRELCDDFQGGDFEVAATF